MPKVAVLLDSRNQMPVQCAGAAVGHVQQQFMLLRTERVETPERAVAAEFGRKRFDAAGLLTVTMIYFDNDAVESGCRDFEFAVETPVALRRSAGGRNQQKKGGKVVGFGHKNARTITFICD